MLNNEIDYPEPREFRPERFLTSEGLLRVDDGFRDPVDIIFGFGRRFVVGVRSKNQNLTSISGVAQGPMLLYP